MTGLLVIITILLFLPWTSARPAPTVDLRTELIWSSVATVVIGAVALAFPSRWMSYIAALPTLGAITDLGPVFLPETGSYPWPVKACAVVLSVTGIGWIVTSMRHPAREQSTRWVVAPVAAALVVAALWLPWVVVSGIGPSSGQKTAISLLSDSAATGAPGVGLTRLAMIVIVTLGLVGAVLPLASQRPGATRIAMWLTLSASIGLVVFCLLLAVGGGAVQAADYATGIRVTLAGFLLITLVWNARLQFDHGRRPGVMTWQEDTGTIPLITQPPIAEAITPPSPVPPAGEGETPPVSPQP